MPIEVRGLKEALKTINDIEPGLRRQITKDMRKIAEPALQEIRDAIPNQPPLSGMDPSRRGNPSGLSDSELARVVGGKWHWTGNEKKLPRLILNGKKPRIRRKAGTEFVSNVGTIIISAHTPKKSDGGKGAAFAIADMANGGKKRPDLAGSLNNSIGRQGSRFMWYGANRGLPAVEDRIRDAAHEIIKTANRLLAENPKA